MYEIGNRHWGTFTDAILIDDDRRISMAKVPTIMSIIEKYHGEYQAFCGAAPLFYGRTAKRDKHDRHRYHLTTNTVVEKKGAKCCCFTPRGSGIFPN